MRITKYALAMALGLIGLMGPSKVRADNIVVVTVSGLTINGNNTCGPTGNALCTLTLNETFQWDNSTKSLVSGSLSESGSGFLGSVFAPGPFNGLAGGDVATEAGTPAGDIIVVDLGSSGDCTLVVVCGTLASGLYPLIPSFGPPTGFASGYIDLCTSATCKSGIANFPNGFAGTGSVSVSAVPEPSPLLLLGAGLLGLMGMTLLRKRLA